MKDNLTVKFYDTLHDDYDRLTADSNRWDDVPALYRGLLDRFKVRRVIDLGSGTGGEAIALAKLGLEVVGVDASGKFIDIAKGKVAQDSVPALAQDSAPEVAQDSVPANLKVQFEVDDITRLDTQPDGYFDLAVCRGNTLAHFLDREQLTQALAAFGRMLRPGGGLVLQWLNYARILKEKRRLVGVTGNDDIYLRFYDFLPDGNLQFNILAMKRNERWQVDWNSTLLHPWLPGEVGECLAGGLWNQIQYSATPRGEPFNEGSSPNVTLIAELKSQE